jgi:hypothetical protein
MSYLVCELSHNDSGERRQLACGVRQLAEHDFVGKLPTNAGWQPALPEQSPSEIFKVTST